MKDNLQPFPTNEHMSVSRLRSVQIEAGKANEKSSKVVCDNARGLSDVFRVKKDTVISGGADSVRSFAVSQIIRAYGSDRAVIVLHCGNRLLENKLCDSNFSAAKGGAYTHSVDPFDGLDKESVDELLRNYLEHRGCSSGDELEALEVMLDTVDLFSNQITLRSVFEVSSIGLAKQLIALEGMNKISPDELEERLEILDMHRLGQKTVTGCIKELGRALDINAASRPPSLASIIESKGVLCIDLGKMDMRAQNLLSFLTDVISKISDKLDEEPLLVFDSVPPGCCKAYEDFISSSNILKIISGADLTTMLSKAEDSGIFSSARHRVFFNHAGESADIVSKLLGEYSGLAVDVNFQETRGFWDITPTKTAVVTVREDEHKKRIKSSIISQLPQLSAIVLASCSSEIVITNIGGVG